jgi:hypothetical protein
MLVMFYSLSIQTAPEMDVDDLMVNVRFLDDCVSNNQYPYFRSRLIAFLVDICSTMVNVRQSWPDSVLCFRWV